MCTKKITQTEFSIKVSWICKKPEYKDGLCKKHYDKMIHKALKWGDRPDYRPATQEDLDNDRSLKLRTSKEHILFKVRNGIVFRYYSKPGKYIAIDMDPDPEIFCVKAPCF